jgi:hypothetical protein
MYLSLRPEDLELPAEDAAALLAGGQDALSEARRYLGAEHVALLLMGYDAGRLPAAEAVRASRDIGALQGALGDLESLALTLPDPGDGRWRALAPATRAALRARLEARWRQRADAAWGALRGPAVEARAEPDAPLHRWLRDLLLFIAHRGVRINHQGELHRGDLRRFAAARELPDADLLQASVALGVALDILMPVGEQVLIGDRLDWLDLPPPALARASLSAWVEGRALWQLGPLCSLGGLLRAWVEPLTASLDRPVTWRHGGDHDGLTRACLAPVAPEPTSALLGEPRDYDLRGLPASFALTHRRLRASFAQLIAALPRGVALRPAALAELTRARVALEHLRRPTLIARRRGEPAALFAAASWLLPAVSRRHDDDLAGWLSALLSPHGLWLPSAGGAALHPQTPTAPLPESATALHGLADDDTWTLPEAPTPPSPLPPRAPARLSIQPSGEALAPPGAPTHALVHLACGARPARLAEVAALTIDRRALMRLVDASLDPRDWARTLADMLGAPLPNTLTEMIEEVARRRGELTLAPIGGVIVADDPVRLQELLSYPKLARHVVLQPTPTMLLLEAGCDLSQLIDQLGDFGFSGIAIDDPKRLLLPRPLPRPG